MTNEEPKNEIINSDEDEKPLKQRLQEMDIDPIQEISQVLEMSKTYEKDHPTDCMKTRLKAAQYLQDSLYKETKTGNNNITILVPTSYDSDGNPIFEKRPMNQIGNDS